MSKWLQSGRRRDICYLLAGAPDGQLRGQRLKSKLEAHYDERLEPKSFYGSLSSLVDAGLVETETEGLYDVYTLSNAGERRLEAHFEWARDCLGESSSQTER